MKNVEVKCHMLAFEDREEDGSVKIRKVQIPKDLWDRDKSPEARLELVFHFGQNENQSQMMCSLSVGDVVELKDKLYVVTPLGFRKITKKEYKKLLKMDRKDLALSELVRGLS